MAFRGDLRTVLSPRAKVNALVDRLTDAMNRAEGATLSLREVGILVTFIAAARRVARLSTGDEVAAADVAAMRLELQHANEAWAAAERRLWDIDRASGPCDSIIAKLIAASLEDQPDE